MAMIVSPFGFREVEVEGVSGQSLELCQPDLCQTPEAFDAVDLDSSFAELIVGMIDAEVAIAEIDQTVVAAQPSELMTVRRSTRPRMMPWRVGLEQSGTISV